MSKRLLTSSLLRLWFGAVVPIGGAPPPARGQSKVVRGRRGPVKVASLVILASIVSIGSARAQEGDPRMFLGTDSQIRGFVRARGCVPAIHDISLRAMPVRVDTTRSDAATLDVRAHDAAARFSRTDDAHLLSFVIHGLQPATPYLLTIAAPVTDRCGTWFWRSDSRGLAVSGGEPVLIEGIAVTTSIEVLRQSTDDWGGADTVDFMNPAAASRRLRWRSTLPGVVGGELQVSTVRFPSRGDVNACDEPEEGIVYRQAVSSLDGEWIELQPIDFNQTVVRRLERASVAAQRPTAALRLLLVGAPIYVRIVPLTPNGPACDTLQQGVPGWVLLGNVAADSVDEPEPSPELRYEPASGHEYKPPFFLHWSTYQPHTIYPTYGEWGYRVVKPHWLFTYDQCSPQYTSSLVALKVPYSLIPIYADPMGCALVRTSPTYSGALLNAGFRFVMKKHIGVSNGSQLEQIVGGFVTGVTGVAGVIGTVVPDWYNAAVDSLKDVAYDFLLTQPVIGQFCSSHEEECRKGVDTGVTMGMTYLGLPSSLPNWDGLKEEGLDYLAGLAAEQLEEETGGALPSELTHYVLKTAVKEVINQASGNRGGSAPTNNWYVADVGFTPASWTLAIKKNTNGEELLDVAVRRIETALFVGGTIPLPHKFPPPLFPGITPSFLAVPMVLMPNLKGIPPPICRSSFYTNPPQTCVPGWFLTEPRCESEGNGGYGWKVVDCASVADLVAIYYRNAWAARVANTKCTPLFAVTVAKGPASTQYIIWPHYSFGVGANVLPMVGVSWDGAYINACGGV
jgi:hypothetical protein